MFVNVICEMAPFCLGLIVLIKRSKSTHCLIARLINYLKCKLIVVQLGVAYRPVSLIIILLNIYFQLRCWHSRRSLSGAEPSVCPSVNLLFKSNRLPRFLSDLSDIWLEYAQQYNYNDVIMNAIASQITSPTIVYSTVYSVTDQRKYRSSGSRAFVRRIHRWQMNSPHMASKTANVSIWCRHMIAQKVVEGEYRFCVSIFRESLVTKKR